MIDKEARKELLEKWEVRDGIIDRAFGMFYGIGQLMPLLSLWEDEFELPMRCLRFCLQNIGKIIQAPENDRQSEPDFNFVSRFVSNFPLPAEDDTKQKDDIRFAYAFYILLLYRLCVCKMKSFSAWRACIDTLGHEALKCGLYDAGMVQVFWEKLEKDNAISSDITMKWKNPSPLDSLAGAVRFINTCWSAGCYGEFGIRGIRDSFELNANGTSRLLEPNLFPVILGSIVGALIGRYEFAILNDGCEIIGRQELRIAADIGNMMATPGLVPGTNEGFFTNILIVTDNPDDETSDMAKYLKLKYPNASIYTLICQDRPIALLEKLYGRIAADSIDLVIGMRSVASVVCQMRNTAKILIFPEFHNIWSSYNGAVDEESLFGGMTFKEKGLAYGVLTSYNPNNYFDSRLYWKYYRSGVQGCQYETVNSYLLDNLSYTIWNLCTPTVLPEHKPFPY